MSSLSTLAEVAYEPSDETLDQCIDLFNIFTNLDTIHLFMLAEKGIKNSKSAMKELALTPKRYYSRLKVLVDEDILEKVNGVYVYTPTGEILHRLGLTLMNFVDNRQRIGPLLNLSKLSVLSEEESQKINSIIFMDDDMPYMLEWRGKPTGLVELPVEWMLDDWPQYDTERRAPEDAYRIWKPEFEGIYRLGRYFGLTCHPQATGRISRLDMLEKLITEMEAKGDVWFATCREVADWSRKKLS